MGTYKRAKKKRQSRVASESLRLKAPEFMVDRYKTKLLKESSRVQNLYRVVKPVQEFVQRKCIKAKLERIAHMYSTAFKGTSL